MGYLTFHIPFYLFVLRCAYIATFIQIVAMFLFEDLPSLEAISSLLLHLVGILVGIFFYILARSGKIPTKRQSYRIESLSERKILIIAFVCILPLIPDVLTALDMSFSNLFLIVKLLLS